VCAALLKTDQLLMLGKLSGGSPHSGLEEARNTTFHYAFHKWQI